MLIGIDDPADERLDDYRNLRGRESDEVLWAEGPTVVERLVSSGRRVRSVLASTKAAQRFADLLGALDVPVLVTEAATLNAVVGFNLHRGLIAVADRPRPSSIEAVTEGARRLVILEGVNDPENLGAIARSARALGADGLVLDPTCADPYYRRSIRTSMGELLHLPIARCQLDRGLPYLLETGWQVWALTPRRDAAPINSIDVPPRLAVMVGAEGPGLSSELLDAYTNVRIPIRDDVDSLNVGHAVAAALAVVQSQGA